MDELVFCFHELEQIILKDCNLILASGALSSGTTTDLDFFGIIKCEESLNNWNTSSMNNKISMVLEICTSSEFSGTESYLALISSILHQLISFFIAIFASKLSNSYVASYL